MDHPKTKGHEPMRPDPAEAVRPPLSGSSVDRIMYNMHSSHAMLSVRIGVARHEEPIGQHLVRNAVWCCRGRPATNTTPQLSTYAGGTQSSVTSCKRSPFWVLIAIGSHDQHGTAHICRRRRLSRRNPADAS